MCLQSCLVQSDYTNTLFCTQRDKGHLKQDLPLRTFFSLKNGAMKDHTAEHNKKHLPAFLYLDVCCSPLSSKDICCNDYSVLQKTYHISCIIFLPQLLFPFMSYHRVFGGFCLFVSVIQDRVSLGSLGCPGFLCRPGQLQTQKQPASASQALGKQREEIPGPLWQAGLHSTFSERPCLEKIKWGVIKADTGLCPLVPTSRHNYTHMHTNTHLFELLTRTY